MDIEWQLIHDRDRTWHLMVGGPFASEAVCGWEPPVEVTLQTSANLTSLNCEICQAHPEYKAVLRAERDWMAAELARVSK